MKCFECNEEMECKNDVCTTFCRMDFLTCPNCKSEGYIKYNPRTNELEEVTWKNSKAEKCF